MGGLTGIDRETNRAELYIFVNPDLQGHGIGEKATQLLCEYGFGTIGLDKIYLQTNGSNHAAQRVYRKVGFSLEGRLRNETIVNNAVDDRLCFGLLKSEFESGFSRMEIAADVPLETIEYGGRCLHVFRDDLYPMVGGGNKARKAAYYEDYMRRNGYDACVTTGGIQSNHNRAIALMCARNGWHCHIVYHGSQDRFDSEKGNALLVRKSGASVEFVEASGIGPAMDNAIENLKSQDYNPLYIHGGGHDLSGGIAFADAVMQLKRKCEEAGFKPKYIFHASGTGSTQAGIAVGLDLAGWSDVTLIGISVARQKERGTAVIEDFANELAAYYGLGKDYKGKINFLTDYLSGGYEQYTPDMETLLDDVMKHTGIMFDTTYSGKAFFGMIDYLKHHPEADSILFWHTGGIMNMQR